MLTKVLHKQSKMHTNKTEPKSIQSKTLKGG